LPEGEGSSLSDCNAPYGYDCGDISVLQQFIDVNSQVFRHYMDYNANNTLEPLEFGYQVWDNGRLIQLNINYSPNVIMQQDNPSELDNTNYRLTNLPNNIGDLTALESLFIHDNEIVAIPDGIRLLTKLKILDLENNLLSKLPEIDSLVNLERLVLGYNQLDTLTESIGSLTSLERLWLQHNKLEFIPESLENLSDLEWLYLNDNFLGSLPLGIGNMLSLEILNIENNVVSFLPESMCDIVNNNLSMYHGLETLSIGNNKFCDLDDIEGIDGMPSCIEEDYGSQNCVNCAPWEFNISGYCADSTDYKILQYFLNMNPESQSLPGQQGIPESADECINEDWWEDGRLVEITFQHKQITSIIPDTLGYLDRLRILRLTGNKIKGELPVGIFNLNDLRILKLNSNRLSGGIQVNIGDLSNIDTLWLNNNTFGCFEYDWDCDPFGEEETCCKIHCDISEHCDGNIPESITNLDGLQSLQLQNNQLTGSIPTNIGDIDSLKYFYLDNNILTGEIPASIGNLKKLRRLYLLNNELSGEIPDSVCMIYEQNENFKSYFHNNSLCPGLSGYPTCIPNNHLGPQNCQD
jgi:Leucine-rich repeat (LRR) protein